MKSNTFCIFAIEEKMLLFEKFAFQGFYFILFRVSFVSWETFWRFFPSYEKSVWDPGRKFYCIFMNKNELLSFGRFKTFLFIFCREGLFAACKFFSLKTICFIFSSLDFSLNEFD